MEKVLKILFKSAAALIALLIVIIGQVIDLIITLLTNLEDENRSSADDQNGPFYNMNTGEFDPMKNGVDLYADDVPGKQDSF